MWCYNSSIICVGLWGGTILIPYFVRPERVNFEIYSLHLFSCFICQRIVVCKENIMCWKVTLSFCLSVLQFWYFIILYMVIWLYDTSVWKMWEEFSKEKRIKWKFCSRCTRRVFFSFCHTVSPFFCSPFSLRVCMKSRYYLFIYFYIVNAC